jgi:hypothetical protein
MQSVFSNAGHCLTCDRDVTFNAATEWFRDYYVCEQCGSIPRERALMFCVEKYYPAWRSLKIHESSPCGRGASVKLKNGCPGYVSSQFFPNLPRGSMHPSGQRCEDLEQQTFGDAAFDLVISQDVLEHIFDYEKAFTEIARTLKKGGAHICTVPLINKEKPSGRWAVRRSDGTIEHLHPAEYHGNPIDDSGSLVTMHWGYDICDAIARASGLTATIVFIDNISLGIRAEYIEVLVCRK